MTVRPDGGTQCYYGIYPALVSDSEPDSLGRIEVELPWAGTNHHDEAGQQQATTEPLHLRATLMSPWASGDQGLVAIPETGSQVMVAFEAGNVLRPYVVGACWNGVDRMPHQGKGNQGAQAHTPAHEDRRVFRTKHGHYIELDDGVDGTKIVVSTSQEHRIELDEDADSITVRHKGGHTLVLHADGRIEINANSTVDIKANAVNVKAMTSTFQGDVICKNLTAQLSITSPLYSQGTGNLW